MSPDAVERSKGEYGARSCARTSSSARNRNYTRRDRKTRRSGLPHIGIENTMGVGPQEHFEIIDKTFKKCVE
jgi:hypothetical protein